MILAVELGNTRTKCTRFSERGEALGETAYFETSDSSWKDLPEEGDVVRIANTARRPLPEDLNAAVLTLESPWPFVLACSPTLGIDRILALVGARQHVPTGPLGIISCGTCLTGTLLDAENQLLGGPISPGWTMRLQAMAHFAPALPPVTAFPAPLSARGTTSTEESMRQGAFAGMQAEIDQLIQVWREEFPTIQVFITGGDGPAFAKPSESGIFAASNLEALGLWAQYQYEKHS